MFLRYAKTGDLIRIDNFDDLINPCTSAVQGCDQAGEEEQDAHWFAKEHLVFPSGEPLPQCWMDVNYRAAPSPMQPAP